jgi:hypothetical protein
MIYGDFTDIYLAAGLLMCALYAIIETTGAPDVDRRID